MNMAIKIGHQVQFGVAIGLASASLLSSLFLYLREDDQSNFLPASPVPSTQTGPCLLNDGTSPAAADLSPACRLLDPRVSP